MRRQPVPIPLASLKSLFITAFLLCVCLSGSGAHAQQKPAPNVAPDDIIVRGIELYKQDDSKGAIKLLRDAVKKHKANADAWLYLGMAYAKTEELKKAREALQQANKLRPGDVATLNSLAYALLVGGDEFGAMKAAMEAVKTDKQNFLGHYLLATVNYRTGRFARALEDAETVLKLKPDFTSALYLKGQSLLSLSDQAQTSAGNETPEVRSILTEKSNARFVEATQTLETFIRLAPNAPEVPKLREELTQMRLYRDAMDVSNPNRTIFSSRDVTSRAVIQGKPEPLYTERARRNQVRGMVRLRLVLGADGKVQHVYATRKLPDGLTEAAIAAARKIKFIPAIKDGRPVSQFVTIEYNFNIY